MLYVLFAFALAALVVLGLFVRVVVRTAVKQLLENRRADREAMRLTAYWSTMDPDVPVPASLTDKANTGTWAGSWVTVPVGDPLFGPGSDELRAALRQSTDDAEHSVFGPETARHLDGTPSAELRKKAY